MGARCSRRWRKRNFPAAKVRALASSRSAGTTVPFKDTEIVVEELTEASFAGTHLALFSAGGGTSKRFAPFAPKAGCVVVDNSSAWRMDPTVPLVVPEVNPDDVGLAQGHHRQSQLLHHPDGGGHEAPAYDAATIKRVVVSTYQAVSGTGQKAIDELEGQVRRLFNGQDAEPKVYPHQIAFNCLPHIDVFSEGDYTFEEIKMIKETKKIMGDDSIKVTATTVRVPVFYGHSESVNLEFAKPLSAKQARAILAQAPGIQVYDNPGERMYPMPVMAAGEDEVFVGRIREDDTVEHGLNLWVVADNIRKGAALNAVQIAELLLKKGKLKV